MQQAKRTKIALDESRISILGVQILLGFQLQAPFQQHFEALPDLDRLLSLLPFGLLNLGVALLIAPVAVHRIAGRKAHPSLGRLVTWSDNLSLAALALSVGIDLCIIGTAIAGRGAGLVLGAAFCIAAAVFWYGIGLAMRRDHEPRKRSNPDEETDLSNRIDQVLTEARVVLPGVQAMFGFQLVVVLSEAFQTLSATAVYLHLVALSATALAAIMLIAPASYHRIVYRGEEGASFPRIAGRFLMAGTLLLAIGMAADAYVIVDKVLHAQAIAALAAGLVGIACIGLWHLLPMLLRHRVNPSSSTAPASRASG